MTRIPDGNGDRLLASLVRRDWALFTGLLLVSLILTGTALLLPFGLGRAVDAAVSRSGDNVWLIACAVLAAVSAVSEAVADLANGLAGTSATARLRGLLAGHVVSVGHRLPERGGDTVSRIIGSTAAAGTGPAEAAMAVASVIPPLGAFAALGLIDPWLALAFAVAFPALAFLLRRLARDSTQIAADYGRAQGAVSARLLDALAGARTIAAAGTQAAERRRILDPLPELRRLGHATWRVQARASAQTAVIAPVLQVSVVAIAGIELARHHITPGGLAAASQYAALATGIGTITGMVTRLGAVRGSARRVAGLLEIPAPEYGNLGNAAPAPGTLAFRGVTARRGGRTVLRGLDLTVPGGAAIAIVGRSGAGKSTLVELAGRLADPDEGTVTLDGTELRALTRPALREAAVYAFERPHPFGGTPAGVIGFGPSIPADGDIAAAAAAAQASPFIERLVDGYDTPLEKSPLSGGELQRLGLARAFAHARNARLLILDDATSSLDTVTEMLVSRTVTERLAGRTRLIVAHRAATAARADLVAWLDKGRIRAVAPHEALWRDADYRALWHESDGEDRRDAGPAPRRRLPAGQPPVPRGQGPRAC